MTKTTRKLRIHGRVQGVFYRESMRQQAIALEINGWVRNRMDGSVEAVIQGDQGKVEEMIAWARQGPAHARVERIEIDTPSAAETFSSFERLPTA